MTKITAELAVVDKNLSCAENSVAQGGSEMTEKSDGSAKTQSGFFPRIDAFFERTRNFIVSIAVVGGLRTDSAVADRQWLERALFD